MMMHEVEGRVADDVDGRVEEDVKSRAEDDVDGHTTDEDVECCVEDAGPVRTSDEEDELFAFAGIGTPETGAGLCGVCWR